jgi:hypothetical protein
MEIVVLVLPIASKIKIERNYNRPETSRKERKEAKKPSFFEGTKPVIEMQRAGK